MEYLKDKINELETNNKNKNIKYLYKRTNKIKFRECLLSFSPKSFVFPSRIKKPKD
jgi:hypothetical protein